MALSATWHQPAGAIPTQPQAVRGFFTFCQLGVPLLAYPVLAALLYGMGEEPRLCQGGEGGGVDGHVSRFAPNRTLYQDSSGFSLISRHIVLV